MTSNNSLQIAMAATEAFRKIDPNIGAQTVVVFLTVASRDGEIMVSDLERLCGLTRTGASHNFKLLSNKKLKDGRTGYGLVEERRNPTDERVKMLRLTATGKYMIANITQAIEEAKR